MLATLLIIRQFLQNVKEVLQPYLYERHKLGDLTLRAVWDLLLSVLLKYARLAAGKAQASPTEQDAPGSGLRSGRPGWGASERRSVSFSNSNCSVKCVWGTNAVFVFTVIIYTTAQSISHYLETWVNLKAASSAPKSRLSTARCYDSCPSNTEEIEPHCKLLAHIFHLSSVCRPNSSQGEEVFERGLRGA